MFSINLQVRYSEVGRNGNVEIHQILDYFQDCSTFHVEDIGYGLDAMIKEHIGWFLLGWNVKIIRYPHFGEYLKVSTVPYKLRGFFGYRRFYIEDQEGNVIVKADSMWVLMDIQKLVPVRIPKKMIEGFVIEEGIDKTVNVSRKLPTDGDFHETDVVEISRFYLDTNGHVNNSFYAMWAEGMLPEGTVLSQIKIDYRVQAVLGDKIHISFYDNKEGMCKVRYENQKGELNSVVIMGYRKVEDK